MEEHLTDDISAQDVADRVYLSPFFLQKGFSLMTGYGIGEYIPVWLSNTGNVIRQHQYNWAVFRLADLYPTGIG